MKNYGVIFNQDNKSIVDELNQINDILKKVKDDNDKPGLMGGNAGVALFYFYYAKFINKQKPYDKGLEILSSIFESIEKGFSFHTHASGIAGIGSVIEILVKQDFIEADTDEMLGELDSYEDFGFLEGIAGIGLSLISAISDTDPSWDECLLLS